MLEKFKKDFDKLMLKYPNVMVTTNFDGDPIAMSHDPVNFKTKIIRL